MIMAIYLAAGKSSRMGEAKLSLKLNNNQIGNIALSVLIQSKIVDYVIVVVNKQDKLDWISSDNRKRLMGESGEIIVCTQAEQGQSFSLREGFVKACSREAEKILICLADQPFISEFLLESLANEEWKVDDDFVACSHQGIIKPPILFHKKVYGKLLNLKGDVGAKMLIQKGELSGKKIEFSEDIYFYDIDTKEDYYWIKERREYNE